MGCNPRQYTMSPIEKKNNKNNNNFKQNILMKKIVLSLLVLAATVNAFAITTTGKAQVTLTSKSGYTCKMTLLQADELNANMDATYSAEINMESRPVALYVMYNGVNYQSFAAKTLGEVKFGLKTNADTEYTLTVANAAGALMLKDAVTGKTIKLVNGATYTFTAEANKTITDRFALTTTVPYEICHRYGALQITGYPESAANVVVKDEAGVEVKNVAITDHVYQEIDLTGLAAGHYTVEANGQTLTISVQ